MNGNKAGLLARPYLACESFHFDHVTSEPPLKLCSKDVFTERQRYTTGAEVAAGSPNIIYPKGIQREHVQCWIMLDPWLQVTFEVPGGMSTARTKRCGEEDLPRSSWLWK